eukprot:2067821-Rhodomonas_salina.1
MSSTNVGHTATRKKLRSSGSEDLGLGTCHFKVVQVRPSSTQIFPILPASALGDLYCSAEIGLRSGCGECISMPTRGLRFGHGSTSSWMRVRRYENSWMRYRFWGMGVRMWVH